MHMEQVIEHRGKHTTAGGGCCSNEQDLKMNNEKQDRHVQLHIESLYFFLWVFQTKYLSFVNGARIFKLLRSPGIDSNESFRQFM